MYKRFWIVKVQTNLQSVSSRRALGGAVREFSYSAQNMGRGGVGINKEIQSGCEQQSFTGRRAVRINL